MARFLLAKPARFFRQKVRLDERIKQRKRRKLAMIKERQAQFRKGFGGTTQKEFDVKPQLPTRGKSRTKQFKRRIKRRFF